ncbi:hypothetical protein GCM10009677_37590 [Sphaerisporangium rubeum]|uniref:Secreted protein n=1 Tax=Sphaerisporangium rubeum TaxID=321317 RepID=A0A7X0IEP5_9ACTN|nr:hypothetical protein [Sphaerisporangium rubeum]MBB6473776.1 hypothetical protein [Sphaerisporangium rubeum]
MHFRTRAVRLAALVAMSCAMIAALTTGPADADRTPSTPFATENQNTPWKGHKRSYTVTLVRTAAAVSANGQALAAIITCGGGISNPTVVGTQVVETATAQCDAVVDTIDLAMTFVVNGGGLPWQITTGSNVSQVGNSRSVACTGGSATYQTLGAARFTKAGYANSPLVMSGGSATYTLSC